MSDAMWARVQARAENDPAFLEELRTDFAGALMRETGWTEEQLRQHAGPVPDSELAEVAGGIAGGTAFTCPKCNFRLGSDWMFELHKPLCDVLS